MHKWRDIKIGGRLLRRAPSYLLLMGRISRTEGYGSRSGPHTEERSNALLPPPLQKLVRARRGGKYSLENLFFIKCCCELQVCLGVIRVPLSVLLSEAHKICYSKLQHCKTKELMI